MRSYWASHSTDELQAALIEYEAKAPVLLADVILDMYYELAERSKHFCECRQVSVCSYPSCDD